MLIPITDLASPALDDYARRTENQLKNREHPEAGRFIAESPLVIGRALDAGCRPVSALMEARQAEALADSLLPRLGDIPVYVGAFDLLTELTGFQLTRGALCVMERRPLPDPASLCRNARRVAVLEEVENPTNVGAILRSAAALGMDAVLLSPACADPLYRRAIRVSMGTVFQIPWTILPEGSWPEKGIRMLHEQGFRTAAMALRDDARTLDDPALAQMDKLALVLGTEGDGLKPETIAQCDFALRIPMEHGVDSLNVAAASAVAFWQLRK